MTAVVLGIDTEDALRLDIETAAGLRSLAMKIGVDLMPDWDLIRSPWLPDWYMHYFVDLNRSHKVCLLMRVLRPHVL